MPGMNIDGLVAKILGIVDRHQIREGVYSRYLWQDAAGSRKMGVNEYGCADAANIRYTVGQFPREPEARAQWVKTLQGMQDPETGLFHEHTHHPIHTTAHCLSALELFDALPLHPLTALLPYLETGRLHDMLWHLDWDHNPWPNSHQGAGLYAAMVVSRTADLRWQQDYFAWLREHADPETGLGLQGRQGDALLAHQLYGWFHYFFNHEYARQPIPYPEALIDSCIALYRKHQLTSTFGREIGFMEIDWVFAMNRAARQTAHRFGEVKALLSQFAADFVPWLDTLNPETDEGMNDLHMLFGTVCVLSELQLALPGQLCSTVPLKNVLDRRPFI